MGTEDSGTRAQGSLQPECLFSEQRRKIAGQPKPRENWEDWPPAGFSEGTTEHTQQQEMDSRWKVGGVKGRSELILTSTTMMITITSSELKGH